MAPTHALNLRARLRRIFLRTILGLIAIAAIAFLLDYAIFRLRAATNRSAYGSVRVTQYYAIKQKSGKTQFIFEPPQSQTCVNALFPHSGWLPCWYLNRNPEQRTDI